MLVDLIELLAYVSIIVIAIVQVKCYHYTRIEMQKELQNVVDNFTEALDEISNEYDLDVHFHKKEEES